MRSFTAGLAAMTLVVGAIAVIAPESVAAAEPQVVTGVRMVVEGEGGNSVVGARHFVWNDASLTLTSTTFTATREGAPDPRVDASLEVPVGTTLAVGTYVDTTVASGAPTSAPRIRVGCDEGTGVVVIDELAFQPDGTLFRFAARWESRCYTDEDTTLGTITYNSTIAYPDREITPYRLDFDAYSNTLSRPQTIDIVNHGPSLLHVSSMRFTGDAARNFTLDADPCSGTTIAVGATCTVTVGFHPALYGGRDARLTIVDDITSLNGRGSGRDVQLHGNSPLPDGEFTAVTPARILDTRSGVGAPAGPLKPNSTTVVHVAGRGDIPAYGVNAVVLNVTAVGSTANSFVTLWPTYADRPWVSNLNPTPGKVVANMATVPINLDGNLSVYNALGTTHLLLDIVGYYVYDGLLGSRYHAVDPFRMIDTRVGVGGVPTKKVGPGETLTYNVLSDLDYVPFSRVSGIVLNVTATGPTATSFLTVHPADSPRPNTSNLNFDAGVTVPNLVTVRVPPSGIVSFYNDAGATDVIVDVVGFYSDERVGNAGRFQRVMPIRMYDTREVNDPIGRDEVGIFKISGYGYIPDDATSVILNVTAVSPTSNGYLSVFPDDACTVPTISNHNFVPGQTIPNMVIARLSLDRDCAVLAGAIDVYNATGATHVLIDVAGYFL